MLVANRCLVLFPCADQWSVQETIKRIVASLAKRKYAVWFDLIDMKEDIVDSMEEAASMYKSHSYVDGKHVPKDMIICSTNEHAKEWD